MKKLVLSVFIAIIAVSAFAQSYTANKVTGNVEYLDGKEWKAVTVSTTLLGETQIRSKGIGGSVNIALGNDVLTVRPIAEGKKVSDLIKSVNKIGSSAQFDTSEVAREKDATFTGAARASDAAASLRTDEE